MANVLITGGSGYLGGDLLAYLNASQDAVPSDTKIHALVRNEDQADKVKKHYNALPLNIDLGNESNISQALLANEISIVFFLIDAVHSEVQLRIIRSLAKVQQQLGVQTHVLHTSGAKGFSSHAGFPTNPPLIDTNTDIVQTAEAHGVRAYIFAPCIVYGKSESFGNPISIQTRAIVKAAKAARRVYRVDQSKPVWPVCHIRDNTKLYACMLRQMVSDEDIGYNKRGYYLASSGLVAWDDLYAAMARRLVQHGIIDDESVHDADDDALQVMAKGLGCEIPFVEVSLGGLCTWTSKHGESIGWAPENLPNHIIDTAGEEVDIILQYGDK